MALSHIIASSDISYWHIMFTSWWTYVGIVIAITLSASLLWCIYNDYFGRGMLSLFGMCFMYMFIFAVAGTTQYDRIDTWKQTVAYPYISHLPIQRRDVVYLKVQDTSETTGSGALFTFRVSSYDVTHVLVLYRDNGTVQKLDVTAELAMELSDGEQPYITYQQLPQDLGNDVNAGMYNIVIYLPKDYKFDTIK